MVHDWYVWIILDPDWHFGLLWLIIGNTLEKNIGKVEKQVEELILCSRRVASLRILQREAGCSKLSLREIAMDTIRHLRLFKPQSSGWNSHCKGIPSDVICTARTPAPFGTRVLYVALF